MGKDDPVRVAQVVGPVVLGGVDNMVMNYYRHIDRSKVQFDFIMDGYSDTPIDEEIKALGGRVYKVEPYAKNMVKSMGQYYKIFKENHYQIVHSHMNTLSIFPLFEAWRAGVPIRIAHNHSTAAKGEGNKTVMKYVLRPFAKAFPTHYCACSEYAGRWLFGNRLYDSGKVNVVKNAIDLDRFRFHPTVRKQIRAELGTEDRFVIGHVGRFVYTKNHSFLIDIFNRVHQQNPNSLLMLVGEGPLQGQIREKVEKLGLSSSVLFLGLRQDVPDLLQAMDVFVFPSYYEGFGMAALEAQAAGLPCLMSDAVPPEAKITPLANFLSVSQAADIWEEKILSFSGFPRTDEGGLIEAEGFQITSASDCLMKYYGGLCNDG